MPTKEEIREYFAKFGRKGGKATAKKHTPAQRTEIARKAAKARWAKKSGKAAITAFLLIGVFTHFAVAKDRKWEDAVFLGQESGQNGAAAMPIGTMIVAVPISTQYFMFRAGGLTYCLRFAPRFSGRTPTLTVNGHAKMAIEGHDAHILDEDGKDWKLHIMWKIAPKEEPAPASPHSP